MEHNRAMSDAVEQRKAQPSAEVQLDELDRRIIDLLRQDGRRRFADIARLVGASEPWVRKRVDRLISTGAVHIAAQLRPDIVGRPVDTVVCVTVRPGHLEDVGERLAKLEEVSYVSYVMGKDCDIFLEAYVSTTDDLFRFLARDLGTVAGIEHAAASRVLRAETRTSMWRGENVDREPLEFPTDNNGSSTPASEQQDAASRRADQAPTRRRAADDPTPSAEEAFDDLNRRIVERLRRDGRLRYAQIARLENVSWQTIRRRVDRLLRTGTIQVAARVNPTLIGFPISLIVHLSVERGAIRKVGARLAAIPRVSEVAYTAGSFDMFIEVHQPDTQAVEEFLDGDLAVIPEIKHAEPLQVLRTLKNCYMWPVGNPKQFQ